MLRAPVFSRRLLRWNSTVRGLTNSSAAISAVVCSLQIARSTSNSLWLSGSMSLKVGCTCYFFTKPCSITLLTVSLK